MSSNLNFCPSHDVGAVIKNDKGEYLCLYRLKHPVGLAFVAGHLDDGELPEQGLKREVLEESNLLVKRIKLVFDAVVKTECGRRDETGDRFNIHQWWVYDVLEWEGSPWLKEPNKHQFIRFMPLEEIKQYAEKGDFDPAWMVILKALKIL